MTIEWVDVADNAVKIGLGSAITCLGGWLILKLTQRHEINKEVVAQRLKEIEKKTERYIEFLSMSQSLMQTYLWTECNGSSEDYLKYMRIHNEISITSNNEIRIAAFNLQSAVSLFIIQNKNGDIELIDGLRNIGREQISLFQSIVSEELRSCKEKQN
ncbi:TPA: peptidase M14 [Yersinia enterocolitica]|uniref:peptidase M14 n=1 Tax=Yersinia enterocolitica TaxID=630 RepID=UPI0032F8BCEC|nr:peptidase M14 [Yersinia enterocolitica]EKN3832841.1 peptidase M14 [Yersinia enterocolitica]HDL7727107.1 peptidase M14 [Yersinia enterocolitica]HDL7730929.1 peptidase M14 [Yersinia enterocolitica]HDM8296652.1 peptidase M14 [Yersinia enterocolitica]